MNRWDAEDIADGSPLDGPDGLVGRIKKEGDCVVAFLAANGHYIAAQAIEKGEHRKPSKT